MAVITGFLANVAITGYDRLYLTGDLDDYSAAWIDDIAHWEALPSPGATALTANYPVSTTPLVKVGAVVTSYYDDYYNRIHLNPNPITLGNLLSEQTREVRVWNAYLAPKSLASVTSSGAEGLTLTQPSPAPTTFGALEERTYSLNIVMDGPPSIDASYSFNFGVGTGSPVLGVTGQRVIPIVFMPQRGWGEGLEWKTDIMQSKAGEQRMALRTAPRQTIDYSYLLSPHEASAFRAQAYGWSHRVFAVPVWQEASQIGGVAAGTTTLTFDTRFADYRDQDILGLWEPSGSFETCETEAVSATQITLKRPTLVGFTNAYVLPLRLARTLEGFSMTRDSNEYTKANATYTVIKGKDLGASIALPTYKGLDVMTDQMIKVGSFSERVMMDVDVIDNGTAAPIVATNKNYVDQRFTLSWFCRTREELWRVRQFLHARRGKAKTFWLPTRARDFTLVDPVATSSSSLRVLAIGYPIYYDQRNLMIRLNNGTTHFNTITAGSAVGDGTEQLALEVAVGLGFNPADVEFCCLLHKVRFDSDRVEISYGDNNMATISVPATEVPA